MSNTERIALTIRQLCECRPPWRSCASPARCCASRRSTCRASGTTRRSPRSSCGMDLSGLLHAIPDSESSPPLYYLLGWLWTHVFGTGEVGLAVAVGAHRDGDDPGRVGARAPDRRRSRRARGGRDRRRQPDARVVQPGGPRVRAARPARRAGGAAVAARARAAERRSRGRVGDRRRARRRDALLRDLPRRPAGAVARAAPGRGTRAPGSPRRLAPLGLALVALAPLALGQRANDSASFIRDSALGTRILQVPKQLLVGYDSPAETLLAVLSGVVLLVALAGLWALVVAARRRRRTSRGRAREAVPRAAARGRRGRR